MQIEKLYDLFLHSTGVSTDTRKIAKGNIFFALKGPNFNANVFAIQAIHSGAAYAIVDESLDAHRNILLVNDTLKTLQQLANYHRQHLKTKIVALGGSNGKTTTKELIRSILETKFKTFCTQGNLNNYIGVPLSLLSISAETEFAVIELGANHLDETKLLCEIAEPNYGLITNNGKDHLEGYGSIEGVRKGNGELYDFLRSKNKTAFVCADQEDLMKMTEGMSRVLYGKSELATYRGKITALFPYLRIALLNESAGENEIATQLIGNYNFDNVMAAICIGKYFGVPLEKIHAGIASYIPSNNRSQILKRETNTFILDAYNANPSSMNAALENFSLLPEKNKIVIFGDMLELGNASNREHLEIIRALKSENFDLVILVGNEFGNVLKSAKEDFLHFENVSILKDWFSKQLFSNSYFLLKGSRLIGLEKLLE